MKILRYIYASLLIFCVVFTLFIGKNKIVSSSPLGETIEYKGVLSLWQIDSFEGGSGSRKNFLLKVAREFEKQNEGVLIMVVSHTETSALESIKDGKYPDMISFGNGVNLSNLAELSLGKTYNFKGGKIGQKTFALPWCKGCYYIISNPNLVKNNEDINCLENVVISQADYTQSLVAVLQENITLKDFTVKTCMDAYIDFTSGKRAFFIGTQRDIVRLNNRGMVYEAKPLKNFNDLYQYIAVCSNDSFKIKASKKFIEILLSFEVQTSLNQIDMFSCFYNVQNDSKVLSDGASVRQKTTFSAFILPQKLKEIQTLSLSALNNDKNALNKISKLII